MHREMDIKKHMKSGTIEAVNCTLDNGYEYSYNLMGNGGILSVMDCRSQASIPVGMLSNYKASSIEELEMTVQQMIHLYASYNIFCLENSPERFREIFSRVA